MRLTVLVDNNTFIDQYLLGEPAVSYYIEISGKKILFDAGYSDVFLINAQKLGIDLTTIDMLVLSHGHLDHTWGLSHLVRLFAEARSCGKMAHKPTLIAHPQIFASRSCQSDPEIGSLLKSEELENYFDLQLSQKSIALTEELYFLGEIERVNDFEAQGSIGKLTIDGDEYPDKVMDDSALVYRSKDGLVIITGCSHAGICNIVEQAKRVAGIEKVVDIIGGFHLLDPSTTQLQGTMQYFQDLKPSQVHACHCTDFRSKMELGRVVPLREVGSGLELDF